MTFLIDRVRANREAILRLATLHGAGDVRLFGSAARSEDRPDSDVDLLIALEPGRSLFDLIGFKQDVEDLLGYKVDVVTERALSRYIRDTVLAEAVRL